MYRTLTLIVFITITVVSGTRLFGSRPYRIHRLPSIDDKSNVSLDLCPECINEAVSAINVLANLILDGGIFGTCGDLCGALVNKTNSTKLGVVCDIVCDAVGIDEFIKLIIKSDLDPIWYCEMAKLCPINDQGDAKFVKFQIVPPTARVGTEFIIDCSFTSKNGTGTGMLRITIVTPQNQSATNDFLLEAKKPGTHDQKVGVKTLNTFCNPLKNSCNGFPAGTFNVTSYLCYGECGSHHPHSSIYDVGQSSFVVTPEVYFY